MENKKEKNSTVAISPEVGKKLEQFCKDRGITKKDFLSLSLNYFLINGIDPTKHESPSAELEKHRKRLDQVIGFIRTQEKDKINPMFEAITATEKRIKNEIDGIAKNEILKQFASTLNKQYNQYELDIRQRQENEKMIMAEQRDIKTAIEKLLQLMDEKNKSGLIGKLFG